MARRVFKLSDASRRELVAIGQTIGKLPSRSEPVELRPSKGATTSGEDSLLLLVVGPQGVVASRRALPGPVDLGALRLWLAGAEAAVDGLASRGKRPEAPPLGKHEADLLDEAGFGEGAAGASGASPSARDAPGALERSRMAFELLLKDSVPLEDAAKALKVTTGRLRQRLAPDVRTLYGFKEQGDWRIPRFQFQAKGKLVRGIDKVVPHLSSNAHPLAVHTWFTTPHPDLVAGEKEEPVSPVEWLAAGRDPEEVAQLAEEV